MFSHDGAICHWRCLKIPVLILLQEYEEYGRDEATEGYEVVPLQCFAFEEHDGEEGEDGDGDDLLYHLELHESEGSAIAYESDAVGRYLAGIFEECQEPTDEDDDVEWCVVRDEFHLLQLEVAVPGKGHEDVRYDKQKDSSYSVHNVKKLKTAAKLVQGERKNKFTCNFPSRSLISDYAQTKGTAN